jgi:hypothetical protein
VNRRTAAGLLLLATLILAGRAIRHQLMLGPDRRWREPGWLASQLPPPATETPAPVRKLIGRLSINSCSEDSLTLLPGVGPVLASRLAAARAEGVHFARAEDLCRVRGIGSILSARLAVHLRFDPAPADSGAAPQIGSSPHAP